tara:strand:+ start:279 stop:416 length:138 start_codon:yes stop_codon:yes gene_type:complete
LNESFFFELPHINIEKPATDIIPAGQRLKGAIERGRRDPNKTNKE